MKAEDLIEIKIIKQGAVVCKNAYIHQVEGGLMAAVLQLKTKYPEIYYCGQSDDFPFISLETRDDSFDIDVNNKDKCTIVDFPTLIGWSIWSVQIQKDNVYICFTKKTN